MHFEIFVNFVNFRKALWRELFCELESRMFDLMEKVPWTTVNMREMTELYSVYTQCILILAMSVERWELICRPSSQSLTEEGFKRVSYYFGFSLLALLIPTLFLLEYILFPTVLDSDDFNYIIVSKRHHFLLYITFSWLISILDF